MSSYLSDAMDRIVAMQKEALNTLTGGKVDAVTYWPYQQNDFPYFTNRLAPKTVTSLSEDLDIYGRQIIMFLVVGHATSGYQGELPSRLYDYLPAVEKFFRNNPMLTSTLYPDAPDYLWNEEARIDTDAGISADAQGGLGQLQIGVRFTLSLPYLREIDIEE
jgi:hypothetical protein